MLIFFDNIIEIHNAKSSIDLIFLDFQKAFNKLPHKRLFGKLHSMSNQGKLNNWINVHLRADEQVVLNGASSPWGNQGSMLGAVLFIIFLNNLDRIGLLT
ncbi:hypothetical protein DMUE_4944 [Dictyocoela muelleri]|nr:hypothetical protein DMUE_4944 [Dictyocoela muelleri]